MCVAYFILYCIKTKTTKLWSFQPQLLFKGVADLLWFDLHLLVLLFKQLSFMIIIYHFYELISAERVNIYTFKY